MNVIILINYWNGQSKPRPFSPWGVGWLPLERVWEAAWPWRHQQNVSSGSAFPLGKGKEKEQSAHQGLAQELEPQARAQT